MITFGAGSSIFAVRTGAEGFASATFNSAGFGLAALGSAATRTPAGGRSFMAALFWNWVGGIKVGATPAGGRRMIGASPGELLLFCGISKVGLRERDSMTLKSTDTSLEPLAPNGPVSNPTPGLLARALVSPSAQAELTPADATNPAVRAANTAVIATDDIIRYRSRWSSPRVVFFTFVSTPVLHGIADPRRGSAKHSKAFEISSLCASSQGKNVQHALCLAQRD